MACGQVRTSSREVLIWGTHPSKCTDYWERKHSPAIQTTQSVSLQPSHTTPNNSSKRFPGFDLEYSNIMTITTWYSYKDRFRFPHWNSTVGRFNIIRNISHCLHDSVSNENTLLLHINSERFHVYMAKFWQWCPLTGNGRINENDVASMVGH